MKKAEETGKKNNKLNAANFKIKGFTEEEEKTNLGRPSTLLFINKDSLTNFFSDRNKNRPDAKTSFVMERSSTTNIYNFVYGNIASSTVNNIANLINHYMDYYKGKDNIPDLKYLVIPVSTKTQSSTTSSGSSVTMYTNVYNLMTPASAIFRTDVNNMKMGLIFSNYNSTSK